MVSAVSLPVVQPCPRLLSVGGHALSAACSDVVRPQPCMQDLTGCRGARRTSGEGECEASEGSFMCEDMLRAGYQRFIVDPGVRQAYFPETARKLYTDQVHLLYTRG